MAKVVREPPPPAFAAGPAAAPVSVAAALAAPAPAGALAAGVASASASSAGAYISPAAASSASAPAAAFLSPAAASSAAAVDPSAAPSHVRIVEASSAEHMETASLRSQCPLTESEVTVQYPVGAKLWQKIGGSVVDVQPPADLPRCGTYAAKGLKSRRDPPARLLTQRMAREASRAADWTATLFTRRPLMQDMYKRANRVLHSPVEELELEEGEHLYRFSASASVQRHTNLQGKGPPPKNMLRYLAVSSWNAGALRSQDMEICRAGAFHVLIAQEWAIRGDPDPERQNEQNFTRRQLLEQQGFVPVTGQGHTMVAIRRHLYEDARILLDKQTGKHEAMIVEFALKVPVLGTKKLIIGSAHFQNVQATKSNGH